MKISRSLTSKTTKIKINNIFLSKIIKEEIKKTLYDDADNYKKRKFIRTLLVVKNMIGNTNIPDEQVEKVLKIIKKISGVDDVKQMFLVLKNDDAINNKTLSYFDQILFKGTLKTEIIPQSYKNTIQSPTNTELDRRSAIEKPIEQEDPRKDRKNLVHEEK